MKASINQLTHKRPIDRQPPKTQRNFTDPDSHVMKSDSHYSQVYSCQLAVDSNHHVIVALSVSN